MVRSRAFWLKSMKIRAPPFFFLPPRSPSPHLRGARLPGPTQGPPDAPSTKSQSAVAMQGIRIPTPSDVRITDQTEVV